MAATFIQIYSSICVSRHNPLCETPTYRRQAEGIVYLLFSYIEYFLVNCQENKRHVINQDDGPLSIPSRLRDIWKDFGFEKLLQGGFHLSF